MKEVPDEDVLDGDEVTWISKIVDTRGVGQQRY
jgi:hypothetical protein